MSPDFFLETDNTVSLIRPLSEKAWDWTFKYIRNHVEAMWVGRALIMDTHAVPRQVADIREQGMTILPTKM